MDLRGLLFNTTNTNSDFHFPHPDAEFVTKKKIIRTPKSKKASEGDKPHRNSQVFDIGVSLLIPFVAFSFNVTHLFVRFF